MRNFKLANYGEREVLYSGRSPRYLYPEDYYNLCVWLRWLYEKCVGESVGGCSFKDWEEMEVWELEVDEAGSAVVSDRNGFSDAEYRVYTRDRRRAKYSDHLGCQAVAISKLLLLTNRWGAHSQPVSKSVNQLNRYAACSLRKYNFKSLWDQSRDWYFGHFASRQDKRHTMFRGWTCLRFQVSPKC